MEISEIKQRTNMNFHFKLGKMAIETHEMLVRVKEMLLRVKRQYTSCLNFSCGGEWTEDEQWSGYPLTSTTDENMLIIKEMIRANRRLMIQEISHV
jgi:hypothetical protein